MRLWWLTPCRRSEQGMDNRPTFYLPEVWNITHLCFFHQKRTDEIHEKGFFAQENPSVKQRPSCRRAGGDSQRPRLEYFWRWPEPTHRGPGLQRQFPTEVPYHKVPYSRLNFQPRGIQRLPEWYDINLRGHRRGIPETPRAQWSSPAQSRTSRSTNAEVVRRCQQHSNSGKQTAATLSWSHDAFMDLQGVQQRPSGEEV